MGETCRPSRLGVNICRAAFDGGFGGFDGGFGGRDGGFGGRDGGFGGRDGGFGGRDGGGMVAPDGGPDTGLTCNGTSCDPATQDCCLSRQGLTCADKGSCPGASLSCTSAVACTTGQICCATIASGTLQSGCATSCDEDGGMSIQLCATDAECVNGQSCVPGPLGGGTCGPLGG
jgi:hypothetical protein